MEDLSGASHKARMKFRIREKRKEAGLTQEAMADRLEISVGLYNGLENGKRRMNETYLEGIANILGMRPRDLIVEEAQSISVAGQVGAGAKVPLFDTYGKDGEGPQVECPPGLSPHGIVAVEVTGDSMEPMYSSGDVLFYARAAHDGVPTEAIGRRCVCEDEDGMAWVKQVKLGDEPGLFHLIALNPLADTRHNVRLKWAAPIKLHWPKELVRKV